MFLIFLLASLWSSSIIFSTIPSANTVMVLPLEFKTTAISTDIHIHSQQLNHLVNGKREFYFVDWTKDEKGIPDGGEDITHYLTIS